MANEAPKKSTVKKPETMADFGIRAIAPLTYRGNMIAKDEVLGPHNCDLETAKQWLEMKPPVAEKLGK